MRRGAHGASLVLVASGVACTQAAPPEGTAVVEVVAADPAAPLAAPVAIHVGPLERSWAPGDGVVRFEGLSRGRHEAWLGGPFYADRHLITSSAGHGERLAIPALPMLTHARPPDPSAEEPAFDRVSIHVGMRSRTPVLERRVGGALARRIDVFVSGQGLPGEGGATRHEPLEVRLPEVLPPGDGASLPCVVHAGVGTPLAAVVHAVQALRATGRCRVGATPEPLPEWIDGDASVRRTLALRLEPADASTDVMLGDALAACAPSPEAGLPGERVDGDLDRLARARAIGACSPVVHATLLAKRGIVAAARGEAKEAARWMRRALARDPALVLPPDAPQAARDALAEAPRVGLGLAGGGTVTPPRPSVEVGVPAVDGPHDPVAVQTAIERRAAELLGCYEEERVDAPTLAGTVELRFVVGIDGRALTAAPMGGDLPSAELRRCAAAVVTTAAMPTTEAASRVTVRLRFAAR